MVHLGICYGHNATVAVIRDGELIFCQSEERLNRIKNSTGFPQITLKYIYDHICSPDEVVSATLFQKSVYGYLFLKAHGFKPFQYGHYLSPELLGGGLMQWIRRTHLGWRISTDRKNFKERNQRLQNEAKDYFCKAIGVEKTKVFFMDHHLSHAYSCLPEVKGWGNALIFTLDGVGDDLCATVNLVKDGILQVIDQVDHHNSLGYYYAAVTTILGMKAGEHEFKVMGLAPYARQKYYRSLVEELNKLLYINDNGHWISRVNPSLLHVTLEHLLRGQRFDNIAGAIQDLTERLIVEWVNHWIQKTGIRNIAVTGGVFMNVKACQRLAELTGIEKIYVMPSGADESTAIGCAVWGSMNYEPDKQIKPLRDLYLGMEFSDKDIEKALFEMHAGDRYNIAKMDNINKEVGNLLACNKVVARCSGRMEFGARALGNRSILANPSCFDNLRFINDAIKSRDFWMPFTPSVLEEDMDRYVVNPKRIHAPYMCITFDTTPEARRDLVAAIHPRDFTVRPQCVQYDWNPDYHELISHFKSLSGIGAVLNTSFNLHGEPNVCSPEDAIRTIDHSGLNYLVMGRFFLQKKQGSPGEK